MNIGARDLRLLTSAKSAFSLACSASHFVRAAACFSRAASMSIGTGGALDAVDGGTMDAAAGCSFGFFTCAAAFSAAFAIFSAALHPSHFRCPSLSHLARHCSPLKLL